MIRLPLHQERRMKKRTMHAVAAAAALLVMSLSTPLANAQRTAPLAMTESGRLWFVELIRQPLGP
ncbi:MAG: hypothetical protein ABS84_16320 [Rubrivivax sp. SCN 71-131]|nr:MAG: hypothetical protein ABS84_16320 [Rubrivivax sp. SCN 71-131]